MSVFPHTQLLFEASLTVVISGPYIQILNSRTGDLITTTADRQGADKEALLKSGPVRLAAIDKSGTHLVTSGDDKQLKLWQIDGLKLLNERCDIPLVRPESVVTVTTRKPWPHTTTPSGGKLILGHASFLTAFLLTSDEKFIITADRAAHIRVAGTLKVTRSKFIVWGTKKLVSGGGDPMLKIWDWMTGKLKREIPILHAVEPFIKVKPARRTPRRFEDD
ncbi:hypothetical protein C8F04DRAFT_1202237, partial [Mycena alexandri]